MKRNPNSPWNPRDSLEITPEDYEKQVVEWLRNTGKKLKNFDINHLKSLTGSSGTYTFDGVAMFEEFDGANFIILIECKRYNRPVERDHVLAFHSKMRDVGAHKAIMFSTSGYQKGALEYASQQGIALITFVEGKALYETKDAFNDNPEPPLWANIQPFAGIIMSYSENKISTHAFDSRNLTGLKEWLNK